MTTSGRLAVGALVMLGAGGVACAVSAAPRGAPTIGPSVAESPALVISPPVLATTAAAGEALPEIVVSNPGATALRVDAAPALVRQGLEPGITLRERRADKRAARRWFSVAPQRFTLEPGARRPLQVRVRGFGRRPEVDGAVVVSTTVPSIAPGRKATRLRLRLIGVLAVARPGVAPRAPRVRTVSVRRVGRRSEAWVVVKNPGRVHRVVDSISIGVRRSKGGTVAKGSTHGTLLLPGASRRFRVRLAGRLRPGRYRARTSVALKEGTVRRTVRVRLGAHRPAKAPRPRR